MAALCDGCKMYLQAFLDIVKSRESMLRFLFAHGCLVENTKCLQCGSLKEMDFDKLDYRCHRFFGTTSAKKKKRQKIYCAFFLSARRGTFFEQCHLPIEKVCEFVLYWLLFPLTPQTFFAEQLDLATNTYVRLALLCRQVCMHWVNKNSSPIGGDGKTVEVDMRRIWNIKCKDKPNDEKWVLGGLERESGNLFLVPIQKKDEGAVVRILKERILPKTTIIGECKNAFSGLETEGYVLKTVNHSVSFKDVKTGTHINHILRVWRDVHNGVPKFGHRSAYCEGYLCEFLFKRKVSDSRDRVHAFWKTVGEFYVPDAAREPCVKP